MIIRLATTVASALLMMSTATHAAQLRIYESASEKSPLVAKIQPGTKLIQIYQTQDNKWLKVGDPRDGRVGWVEATKLGMSKSTTLEKQAQNGQTFTTPQPFPAEAKISKSANASTRKLTVQAHTTNAATLHLATQPNTNTTPRLNAFQAIKPNFAQHPLAPKLKEPQPQTFRQSFNRQTVDPRLQKAQIESFQYEGSENLSQDQVRQMFRQLRFQQIQVEAAVQQLFTEMTTSQLRTFAVPRQFFDSNFDGPRPPSFQQQSMNQQFNPSNQAYVIVPEQPREQQHQNKRHWLSLQKQNQKRHNVFNTTSRHTRPTGNQNTQPSV